MRRKERQYYAKLRSLDIIMTSAIFAHHSYPLIDRCFSFLQSIVMHIAYMYFTLLLLCENTTPVKKKSVFGISYAARKVSD